MGSNYFFYKFSAIYYLDFHTLDEPCTLTLTLPIQLWLPHL